jgi:hypothetical protein
LSSFILAVTNSDFPLIPPVIISTDPMDETDMSLTRARQIAATMLQEYISHNNFEGRNARRARTEVNSLEPHHYVSLGALRIELRPKGVILQ